MWERCTWKEATTWMKAKKIKANAKFNKLTNIKLIQKYTYLQTASLFAIGLAAEVLLAIARRQMFLQCGDFC